MRKVSTRNQRSKRIKAKHVLRICVLLGVCIWLIYQVKYSHNKKEFEEKDTELSKISQSPDEYIKFGRKDLRNEQEVFRNIMREEEEEREEVDETVIDLKNWAGDEETKHDDESDEQRDEVERESSKPNEDEQEEEEEEGNKHGEIDGDEVEKETSKNDEEGEGEEVIENEHGEDDGDEREIENDDAQDGGNDLIDEHDQVRTGDTDGEDEFIDEGKEIEEKEDDEEESERRITHKAREENYKADDASSAVSHENEPVNSETGKAGLDNSDENSDKVVLADRTKLNNVEGQLLSGLLRSTTSMEEKDQGNRSLVSDVKSIRESGDHLDGRNIMEVKAEINDDSLVILETSRSDGNVTKGVLDDLSLARNATEVAQIPMSDALNVTMPANTRTADFLTGQSLNLFSNSSSYLPDELKNSNSTAKAGANPESPSKNAGTQNLESSSKNANMQNLEFSRDSSANQTMDSVEYDPIDYSDDLITHEKKENLTDPDTPTLHKNRA